MFIPYFAVSFASYRADRESTEHAERRECHRTNGIGFSSPFYVFAFYRLTHTRTRVFSFTTKLPRTSGTISPPAHVLIAANNHRDDPEAAR